MTVEAREKRDLVLPPSTYAYMQDVTKGLIKTYVGPTVINPTAQEVPVIYSNESFKRCDNLDNAVNHCPVAVEGYYIILLNPAKANKHPEDGSAQSSAELEVGRKIVIPGPANFALWPGQKASVVRGHHLHSNQYLLVRVYNEEEARKNWGKAVVKLAGEATTVEAVVTAPPPSDLTVGKLLIIRGTEVSFYIPPTGITVVAEGKEEDNKLRFVRDALTLERLEYAILINENGKKRYERGPQVVFPQPAERFIEAKDDNGKPSRKFRAIELNEIQGLHIKVIADYEEGGKKYKAGDELFITGKDTAIYFPREEHSAVKYDGKSKHFATAIPAGEARYVMDRLTGQIKMAKGPAMLLPDPRTEVVVRRVLNDKQVSLWYPGNAEALKYNQGLREILSNVPTTRAGAISEGDLERNASKAIRTLGGAGGGKFASSTLASYGSVMESSKLSGDQNLVGEEFSRASNYAQPRTVTLDTKYQGVPSIDIWTGYSTMVVSKTGKRRVEQGPSTVLLEYDEALEVLELSTGKPKTTDNLLRTVFLRVANNKVSDVIGVETSDHVQVSIKVSYCVNFEDDPTKWWDVENYVKYLCDHARSVLKGAIKKVKVEDFYANHADIIRDILLGKVLEGKRTGMKFEQNGMRVTDVEVLAVQIGDDRIRAMLDAAQHEVVKANIDLGSAQRGLEMLKLKQLIAREENETVAATTKKKHELDIDLAASEIAVVLTKIGNKLKESVENQKLEGEQQKVREVGFQADMSRKQNVADFEMAVRQRTQDQQILLLKAEAEAVVHRFKAAVPGFSEALTVLGNKDAMVKVAEAWSIQRALGGESVSDAISRVFQNTPLAGLVDKLTLSGGNGKDASEKVAPTKRV
jgi:major vault protein